MTKFSVIYQTKYGDTVASDNPKLDAYKQAAYLQALGYNWGIIIRDGRYTVQAETVTQHKIADITFEQEEG